MSGVCCSLPGEPAVKVVGDFGWDETSEPTLKEVDFEVRLLVKTDIIVT